MSRATTGAASAAPLATVTADGATPALADQWEAEAIDAIENVQDPAEAEWLLGQVTLAAQAMRVQKLGENRERRWKALRLKAEARYGELLPPKTKGGRPSKETVSSGHSSNADRQTAKKARKVAAAKKADPKGFDDYIANDPEPSREGLLRKAPKSANPNGDRARSRVGGGSARQAWKNDDVIAWAAKRIRASAKVDDLVRDSAAGKYDWPIPGQGLGQNAAEKCKAIAEDRARRGDTTRRREPKESGKRLRRLHAQGRAGRYGDLWELQKAVASAVNVLENFVLPDLDWSEETQDLVAEIYDDLGRQARWNDAALDAVTAHMTDLGRQRKINQMRVVADDPSSTLGERANAARLADKLGRTRDATRLENGA